MISGTHKQGEREVFCCVAGVLINLFYNLHLETFLQAVLFPAKLDNVQHEVSLPSSLHYKLCYVPEALSLIV